VHWGTYLQPQLQWQSNKYNSFWVCVCSLTYPARKAHAPHRHLWPVRPYNIFPHFPINGTIFERKLPNTKCVFLFSPQLLSKIFLILRTTARGRIKIVHWSWCEVPLFCIGLDVKCRYSGQVERNLKFLDRFSKKNSNTKFHYNPGKGSQVVPCGRTEGRTDMTKIIAAFRKFVKAPKNETVPWLLAIPT
jgi:hypothetical protein